MRSFILGVAGAVALGGAAGATQPGYASGPYSWDSSGACRDASGAAVKDSLCPARPTKPADCRDRSSGMPENCEAPDAVPSASTT